MAWPSPWRPKFEIVPGFFSRAKQVHCVARFEIPFLGPSIKIPLIGQVCLVAILADESRYRPKNRLQILQSGCNHCLTSGVNFALRFCEVGNTISVLCSIVRSVPTRAMWCGSIRHQIEWDESVSVSFLLRLHNDLVPDS